MKNLRDVNLDQYDLMEIWRVAYRMGYLNGYGECADESECNPHNDSIPEFISKLLEEEDGD